MTLVRFVAFLLAVNAASGMWKAYVFWTGSRAAPTWYASWGLVSTVACLGLLGGRPWSRHIVYVMSVLYVAELTYLTADAVRRGLFPYETPGVFLIALCVASSIAVFRHFRNAGSG